MQITILYERHCGERIKRLHGSIRRLVLYHMPINVYIGTPFNEYFLRII